MPLSSDRFANSALKHAHDYERRYRKLVPFSEIIDTLRRQAAFDLPLKFVLDRDPDSRGLFKRGPLWDFGNAGVRFEKKETAGERPALVVVWDDEYEQKTLKDTLDELMGLGIGDDESVSIELVSPAGDTMLSRYGNGLAVDGDGTTVHFTGAWQKQSILRE